MPENTNKVIQLRDSEGNDVSPVVNVGSIYDKNGQKVDNLLSYTVAGTDVPVPELEDVKTQIQNELNGTMDAATLGGSTKEEIIASVPAYTHPSTIQCAAATEINNLKSSVSNGKSAIASAITDKGVSTAATATFQTMANNIANIPSLSYGNFNIRMLEQHKVSEDNSPYTFDTTLNPASLYLVTGGYFNQTGSGAGHYIALIYNNRKLPQGFSVVGQYYYDRLQITNNKLVLTGGSDSKAFEIIQVW